MVKYSVWQIEQNTSHMIFQCGFNKFQLVKRTQTDFTPRFSSCHKYISFDVDSDIVYE